MKKTILIGAFAALVAASAWAQGNPLPPGKWWRRPEIVQRLNLSDEQQTRLDAIFRNAANELIDLRAEVEKQSIALRGELDQSQLSRQNIQRIAARLNESRGRLFERELMMLVDMREVLTEAQWGRMRAALEELRMRHEQRPMHRPPMDRRQPRIPRR